MKNQNFYRNIFGNLPTQKMAQDAFPILVSHAQNEDVILIRKLAKQIAPDLTQFNWSMQWVFSWIHTTLYGLERRDDWNYGEIPGITAIVLDKPQKPTKWMDKETRVVSYAPLPWKDYKTQHILPVFKYTHWDKVMDYVHRRLLQKST